MSWSEMLIVAVVALIVVGPKDLPGMFRQLGQFTAKAKRMARDFSRAMEDAADDAGVADVQKTFKAAVNPAKAAADSASKTVRDAVDFDFDALDGDTETAKLAKKRAAEKMAITERAAETKAAKAKASEGAATKKNAPAKASDKATDKTTGKSPAAASPPSKPEPAAKTKEAGS